MPDRLEPDSVVPDWLAPGWSWGSLHWVTGEVVPGEGGTCLRVESAVESAGWRRRCRALMKRFPTNPQVDRKAVAVGPPAGHHRLERVSKPNRSRSARMSSMFRYRPPGGTKFGTSPIFSSSSAESREGGGRGVNHDERTSPMFATLSAASGRPRSRGSGLQGCVLEGEAENRAGLLGRYLCARSYQGEDSTPAQMTFDPAGLSRASGRPWWRSRWRSDAQERVSRPIPMLKALVGEIFCTGVA